MKWWYFLVLIVGIAFGLWMWDSFGIKTATKVNVVEGESDIKRAVAEVTPKSVFDKTGRETKEVEILGSVSSWDSESGMLEIESGGKIWRVIVDPSRMMIYVNSFKNKMSMISVNDRIDPNWKGCFCLGDEVVMRFENEEVYVIFNNGSRTCGFLDK